VQPEATAAAAGKSNPDVAKIYAQNAANRVLNFPSTVEAATEAG
jgi:hypothetical protein